MSPEQQRIKIAEACGWRVDLAVGNDLYWLEEASWPSGIQPKARTIEELPDYLSDLNAMHEAEKVLTADLQLSDGIRTKYEVENS